jgi:preprotein translocase subunit YajC
MALLGFLMQGTSGQGGSFAALALPLIFIFGIFYFLLIMPQQKRQKKWQGMINELKAGDFVTTSGGIQGRILSVGGDFVQLRVPPDNLRIQVAKAAVLSVGEEETASK